MALSGSVVLLRRGAVFVICAVTSMWHDPCSHWLWRARRLLLLWGRDMESFCNKRNKHYLPTSPQSNCIDRKPSKRSLKVWWGAEVWLSTIHRFWRVQEERIQFYLRSWSLGVCPCSSEWGNFFLIFLFLLFIYFLLFFWGWGHKGGGANKEGLGSECDWGAWCEIPR